MSNRKGIIYKAVNKINGKVYIGKTVDFFDIRKRQHASNAFNLKHSAYNTKFYKAIRKYSKNGFEWAVICEDVEENLNGLETKTIEEYNSYKNGYNSTKGGEGCVGLVHTDRVKKIISKASSKRNSGSGNPRYGKAVSKETRIKIAISNGAKPFVAINRFTNTIVGEWTIKYQCLRDLKLTSVSSISKVLCNKKEYYKEYIFKYKESDNGA